MKKIDSILSKISVFYWIFIIWNYAWIASAIVYTQRSWIMGIISNSLGVLICLTAINYIEKQIKFVCYKGRS